MRRELTEETLTGDLRAVRAKVAEQIQWAAGVAATFLPPEDGREIRGLCEVLAQRNADRPLSVGVFGQFSSGKSTLLNALLGAGLLPSAALPTTGVATRLRSAPADVLTVALRTGETLDFGTREFGAWHKSVTGSGDRSDLRAVLRQIMAAPAAAQSLERIDIGLAGTVLGPGVVVIDTPGFDAAEDGHNEVAERVAGEVDLAIVLIPASDPGAMSLQRFLHEVLRDLSDRCVFVLTKFRQVEAGQRADLQRHLESWLEQAGFAGPVVLRADATDIAVAVADGDLSAVTGEFPAAAALAETRSLAEQLSTLAADRRQQLIEATLEVLLRRLLIGVTSALDERRATLQELRQLLGGVRITDLGEFLRDWRRDVAAEVSQSASRSVARERYADGPEDELAEARDDAVRKVGSRNDVSAVVNELLDETEEILERWTRQAMRRAASAAADDLASSAAELRQTFTAQYADLARLSGADPRPPDLGYSLPPIAVPGIDLSAAFEPLREAGRQLQTTAYWKSGGAAAAGAAIGTMILPGIGTAVGAAAGLLAGSGRAKQKQRLSDDAEVMHGECLDAARQLLRRYRPALRAALDDAVDVLVDGYLTSAGPVIARLTADYHARVARLDAEAGEVTQILSQARRRHRDLAEHGLRGMAG